MTRAWLLLTLALQIIITNGLESVWMRGFEMLWIVFLILVAEIARYWKPLRAAAARAVRGSISGSPRTGRPGPSRGPRRSAVSNVWLHSVTGSEPAGSPSPVAPAASLDEGAPATTNQAVRTSSGRPDFAR
jgi:exopolysaccharide production protein ExoQ